MSEHRSKADETLEQREHPRFMVLRVGERWILVDLDDDGDVIFDHGRELWLKAIAKRLNADPPSNDEICEPF